MRKKIGPCKRQASTTALQKSRRDVQTHAVDRSDKDLTTAGRAEKRDAGQFTDFFSREIFGDNLCDGLLGTCAGEPRKALCRPDLLQQQGHALVAESEAQEHQPRFLALHLVGSGPQFLGALEIVARPLQAVLDLRQRVWCEPVWVLRIAAQAVRMAAGAGGLQVRTLSQLASCSVPAGG